jgi:spermidine/putrescine transport system substrate-binding protein
MHEESIEGVVERMIAGDVQSRREFLRRLGVAGIATTGAGSLLAGCGGVEGTEEKAKERQERQPAQASHPKTEIGNWTFSNWPLYMDKKLLRQFDKRFGGKVKYIEEINDNNGFTGRVQEQLRNGVSIKRDIVVLTDTTAAKWIRNGWVEPVDWKNVPNRSNIEPAWSQFDYDPDGKYLLPYQSGVVGIGYDPKLVGGKMTSFEQFFYDEKLKGKVTCLSDEESACFAILMLKDIKPADATLDQKLEAIEEVGKIAAAGQFRRFTGNDYTTDLAKGNAWASMAYSGDIVQLQSDNPNLEFVYPEEGVLLWTDHMMMPAKVEHPYAAETMMNYLYEPEVAASLAAYVNYFTPVKGVKELLAKTDAELANNPLIFPPEDVKQRLYPTPAVSAADQRAAQEAMAEITGG